MRRRLVTLAATVLVPLAHSAGAHHSHVLFYDGCRPVTIEGRIDRVEFKDPHSLIFLRLDDGAAYTVDWAGLRGLTRSGVVDDARAALVPGARVVVTGAPIRSESEIRGYFPDFKGEVSANVVDPASIRQVGGSFTWALPTNLPCPSGELLQKYRK